MFFSSWEEFIEGVSQGSVLGSLLFKRLTLLGLRQFLTATNPLKVMKNVSYFKLKALFVLNWDGNRKKSEF